MASSSGWHGSALTTHWFSARNLSSSVRPASSPQGPMRTLAVMSYRPPQTFRACSSTSTTAAPSSLACGSANSSDAGSAMMSAFSLLFIAGGEAGGGESTERNWRGTGPLVLRKEDFVYHLVEALSQG